MRMKETLTDQPVDEHHDKREVRIIRQLRKIRNNETMITDQPIGQHHDKKDKNDKKGEGDK